MACCSNPERRSRETDCESDEESKADGKIVTVGQAFIMKLRIQAACSLGFGTTLTYRKIVDRTTRRMVSADSAMFRRFVNADRAAAASSLGVPASSLR
jgi:hypothetical protein